MIIDAHLHVDDIPALGWKLDAAECVRRMDEAGIERGVVMTIVDAPEVNSRALELIADARAAFPGRLEAFARIHPWYGDESLALLERAIGELGFKGLKLHPVTTIAHPAGEDTLRRAVVCPVRARGHGYELENDFVAESVAAQPERLIGCARIDPLAPGAAAEIERARSIGLRGLFMHPWEDAFRISDPAVDRLVGELPVIVATGYPWVSEGLQVGELARRHPETPIVATNGAQLNISGLGQVDAELALERSPNLVIQTSGVYREDFLEGVVARFGASRLLFASGFPQFDPRLELLRVQWAPKLDEEARAAILGGNAARIFRLVG